MSQTLNDGGLLFDGLAEQGFELESSPGVVVRPLLTRDAGSALDVFYMTLAEGAEVVREVHPFSETLVVIAGELSCSIEDGGETQVRPGQVWRTDPDRWHQVRNTGDGSAQVAMLIGL